MKQLSKIIKTTIAMIVALLILSAFVVLFGHSGVHISNPLGATDYKWEPYQFKSTMTEGFAWINLDEYGFNNPKKTLSAPVDILVMGSSHMEAVNIPLNENTANRMRELLPSTMIYNIGTSGHTIYQCAKNLQEAVAEYKPSQYVIIETDRVNLDKNQMLEVLDDELKSIPSYDSGMVYYAQKYCPAIKTIIKNLQDWRSANSRVASLSDENGNKTDKNTLSLFLKKMRNDCGERKLVIFYHPKTEIDEEGNFLIDSYGVEEFSSLCTTNSIIFIDMTNDFQDYYNNKHILGHGFINTAIGEGHLNKYGHQIIAERLVKIIGEKKNESK